MYNLRLSKENYEKMVNLTPEILCISDLDGQFRYVNPAKEIRGSLMGDSGRLRQVLMNLV